MISNLDLYRHLTGIFIIDDSTDEDISMILDFCTVSKFCIALEFGFRIDVDEESFRF